MKIRKDIIFFLLGCSVSICSVSYAGISVSPSTCEIVVEEDGISKGKYTVVNEDKEKTHVKVEPEDWLKAKTGLRGMAVGNWLTLTPMEFDLEGQQSQEVEYAIKLPVDIKGEVVAMVFFVTGGSGSAPGTLGISTRIGAPIYAAMANSVKLGCSVKDITINNNTIETQDGKKENKGIMFSIVIENSGNVHLRPTGEIVIKSSDGKEYRVGIERYFAIYPGKSLPYPVTWEEANIPRGKYSAHITLDYGNIYNVDRKIEKEIKFVVKRNGSVSF